VVADIGRRVITNGRKSTSIKWIAEALHPGKWTTAASWLAKMEIEPEDRNEFRLV